MTSMQLVFGISALLSLAAILLMALVLFDRLAPLTAARLGLALERRRSGLGLRSAEVPGFTMPYLEGGTGEPLLLIHGFGGDKDNFTRVARFLTPHYRVICPDLPGFGDASRDAGASYGMAEQAERLRALLDQIAPGRVHLGGNSMGGFIAARFAAAYPERVASLWLLDAVGTEASNASEVVQHYLASGEMPLLLRQEEDVDAMVEACTHRRPFLPYSVLTMLGRRGVADFALHTSIMRQLAGAQPLQSLPQCAAMPALVVWGEQDKILHPAGAAAFAALFPRSRTVMMPDVGHLPMFEAPKRCAQDYLAFRRGQA
ncbi:alpha/beta hydrolase [Pseudoduganella sp. LjRoot289]|uniref:alpha/beta fold hydrolase n=1 Tax=Pseudoduganella sp. LjRoot289 TaxID=3342314 RepID=UPI003ECD6383